MVVSLTAKAQVPMTTDNHSLGPGTYEEATSGLPPPSTGYTKGWQTSKPVPVMSSGGAALPPINNPNQDVPDE